MRGVQYTANQGQEWMGNRATTQRRDFQVSRGESSRGRGGIPKQKQVCQKGVTGMHLYVYIVLIKDCV